MNYEPDVDIRFSNENESQFGCPHQQGIIFFIHIIGDIRKTCLRLGCAIMNFFPIQNGSQFLFIEIILEKFIHYILF